MLVLDSICMVLFDFDDTLCIHDNHSDGYPSEQQYNIDVLLHGKDYWQTSKPNKHMLEFMNECKRRSVRMGLMSAAQSYVHMVSKNEWVQREYGIDLENFCVGKPAEKAEMLVVISSAFSLPKESILLVDDCYSTLCEASAAGFQACTPMEIVNFVEGNLRKGE